MPITLLIRIFFPCVINLIYFSRGRGRDLSHTPAKNARLQEATTAALGRYVVPKPPSSLISETMGHMGLSAIKSVEANDDDYEEYKEKHGDYPEWLYKYEAEVRLD